MIQFITKIVGLVNGLTFSTIRLSHVKNSINDFLYVLQSDPSQLITECERSFLSRFSLKKKIKKFTCNCMSDEVTTVEVSVYSAEMCSDVDI